MSTIFLVIQVILAALLIIFVLLQRSDNDGFGMGSGSGGTGLLSGAAKANFMTRTTAILAAAFMFNSLLMGIIASKNNSASFLEEVEQHSSSGAVAGSVNEDEAKEKAKASEEDKATDNKEMTEEELDVPLVKE